MNKSDLKLFLAQKHPFIYSSFYRLRYLFSPKEYCPFCGKNVPLISGGKPYPRKYARCVFCNSLERHRFLFYLYQVEILSTVRPIRVLHFAPELPFYNILKNNPLIDYLTGDIQPKLYPEIPECRKVDALATGFPDNSFDVVIANHLVEHIDEKQFMMELNRILRKNGKVLLSTPVYEEMPRTLDNPEYNTPELRKKFYGHPEHLRKYGADAWQRFSRFFNVAYVRHDALRPYGDPVNSNCFILTKKDSSSQE